MIKESLDKMAVITEMFLPTWENPCFKYSIGSVSKIWKYYLFLVFKSQTQSVPRCWYMT